MWSEWLRSLVSVIDPRCISVVSRSRVHHPLTTEDSHSTMNPCYLLVKPVSCNRLLVHLLVSDVLRWLGRDVYTQLSVLSEEGLGDERRFCTCQRHPFWRDTASWTPEICPERLPMSWHGLHVAQQRQGIPSSHPHVNHFQMNLYKGAIPQTLDP